MKNFNPDPDQPLETTRGSGLSPFWAVLVFCLTLALTGCSTSRQVSSQDVICNDNSAVRIDLSAVQERLRDGLHRGEVRRLSVLKINHQSVFRVNVSSMFLDRNFDCQVEHRRMESSPIGSDFLAALKVAQPIPSQRVADLRWGFIFSKEDGTRVFSAYCDAEGKNGIINGACYAFDNDALADFADSLFPPWMK